MYTEEFISNVAEEAGISKAAAKIAVKAMVKVVTEALVNRDIVSINNFGKFEPRFRNATESQSPATGELIKCPAHYIAKFTPGKDLRNRVK